MIINIAATKVIGIWGYNVLGFAAIWESVSSEVKLRPTEYSDLW
jgi:hypothetical protein